MLNTTMRAVLALALVGVATFAATPVHAQFNPTVEEHLSRLLADQLEAQVRLNGVPMFAQPLVVLHPRVHRGLLVGEVQTGSIGRGALFESRAFPLDQVRELKIKENRFWRGAFYGAMAGVALSTTLQVRCSRANACGGGLAVGNPAFYALSTAALAGVGGSIAFYATGWTVVYSYSPGAFRIAEGPRPPGR
jgi:hypothetical protein